MRTGGKKKLLDKLKRSSNSTSSWYLSLPRKRAPDQRFLWREQINTQTPRRRVLYSNTEAPLCCILANGQQGGWGGDSTGCKKKDVRLCVSLWKNHPTSRFIHYPGKHVLVRFLFSIASSSLLHFVNYSPLVFLRCLSGQPSLRGFIINIADFFLCCTGCFILRVERMPLRSLTSRLLLDLLQNQKQTREPVLYSRGRFE